jgi:hypothetical protein
LPLSVVLLSASTTSRNGSFPKLWQLAVFLVLASAVPLIIYWLDRRFKLTHWERDVE